VLTRACWNLLSRIQRLSIAVWGGIDSNKNIISQNCFNVLYYGLYSIAISINLKAAFSISWGMLELNFHPFPILETARLRLRKIGLPDQEEFFMLRSSKTVMKYIDRPLAKSREDATQLIKMMVELIDNNQGLTWAISLLEKPKMIGTVHLWKISPENHRAEIGYLLDPAFQGQGLMHETLQTVIHYGFYRLKLHSIEANVNPENMASIRLLEKIGFVREGYLKETYLYEGIFFDSAIYSMLTPHKSNQV
jgi:RimJ/RimL family protein N-acetyltransferase